MFAVRLTVPTVCACLVRAPTFRLFAFILAVYVAVCLLLPFLIDAFRSTAPSLDRKIILVLKFFVLPLKVPLRFKLAGMLTDDGIIPGETSLAMSPLLVLKSLIVRSKYERFTLGNPLI